MKKLLLFLSIAIISSVFANTIVRRDTIIPGTPSKIPASNIEILQLPNNANKCGSFTMWVKPNNWNNSEKAWHFMLTSGTLGGPQIWLYRFANGDTRLLYALNKKQSAEVTAKVNFTANKWTFLAFTWQEVAKGTIVTLYVDGKKIKTSWGAFKLGDKFPKKWQVGDKPTWNPKSKNTTTLGRVALYNRVLTEVEIASLASHKFDKDGNFSIINNNFIPCSKNKITGVVPKDASCLEISYVDELGKATTKKLTNIFKNGTFSTELIIPEDCIETRLTVFNSAKKSLYWQPTQITYADFLPPFLNDYWKASWIWYSKPIRGKITRYVRKTFDVKLDTLENAGFQFACDDHSDIYLNGTYLGKSTGWALPVVKDNLKKLLKNGKNVIAARLKNGGGSAGFFGELSLVNKDGSVTKIGTDDTWKGSNTNIKNWEKVDFDDSKWGNTFILMRPPQLPYGWTPYRNFAKVPVLKLLSGKKAYQVNLGNTVKISATYQAPSKLKTPEVYITLLRKGKELYRTKATVKQNSKTITISANINVPSNISIEKYDIAVDSRTYIFKDTIGSLQLKQGNYKRQFTTALVKKISGVPTIHINNKAVPSMLYRTRINNRQDTLGNAYITPFDKVGVRLVEMNISFAQFWNPDNSLNTDAIDLYLKSAIFYAPNSKFILFINTDAPAWYIKKYSNERFITDKGVTNSRISYASIQYRKDAAAILTKLIKYLESCLEYDAVAGFGLDGGEDGQFMQWTGRTMDYIGDYSIPMKKAFHKDLELKYKTIKNLNLAWKTSYKNFSQINIPSKDRRAGKKNSSIYLDPIKDADIIAFNKVYTEEPANFMLYCAKAIKDATKNQKLVAAYYGKFYSIAGVSEWAELANEKVIASPYLDLMIAVEYALRAGGKPHSIAGVSESYRLHNKIYIDEADLRTFLSGSKSWGYAGNAFETVSMIRKMFIFNLVRAMGIHWYDLHGGMFENKAIINSIAKTFQIAEKKNNAPLASAAEIAVIADEPSLRAVNYNVRQLAATSIRHQQNGNFGLMGAPYDLYLSNDLLHKDFPQYKMYVFLNLWAPSKEVTQAINKLKKDGKTLVFLGNANINNGLTLSAENVSKFTGIQMKEIPGTKLTMQLGIPGKVSPSYTSCGATTKLIVPNDKDAKLYGRIVDIPNVKPFAIKKFANYTVIHSAVPVLSPEMWKYLAKEAKVHIYSNNPDTICYVGRDMIGIHTGVAGTKVINFPSNATFIDAITNKVVSKNSKVLKIDMKQNETKLLYIKK